jgi:hypothetical protein
MEIPDWDVHEIDRDLYILRQSPCASYEKPFVFLLFGDDRATRTIIWPPRCRAWCGSGASAPATERSR